MPHASTWWTVRHGRCPPHGAGGGLQPLRPDASSPVDPAAPAASFHARHPVSHAGAHAAAHDTAASLRHRKPEQGNMTMKNFILAAFAALGLSAAVVPAANAASTVASDAQATRMQQTGAYGGNG